MARATLAEVMSLRQSMKDELSYHLPTFRWLAHFIAPNRYQENPEDRTNNQYKIRRIIKNQGGRSLRTFVSGMMNGATPRSRPWFNLTVSDERKASMSNSKKFFSQTEKILNSHFQMSNLYRVLPLSYKDVGVFSTSAFAMLPHPTFGFYFYPFAIGTYGFSCDLEGNPVTFYRDFSMTVRQIVETYANINATGHIDWNNIPEFIKQHWDAKRYTERFVLSQVVMPNSKFVQKKLSLDPADKKFQSYTYITSAGSGFPTQSPSGFRNELASNRSEFLRVGGYDYFPVIIPRWEVQADRDWGCDGPGDIALGDIMTLNELEKYRLEGIAKLVKPPMVGHASLRRHQSSILAGGITYVDDAGALAGFKPAFQLDPKLAELVAAQQEYTQAVRTAYYEDLFTLFSGQESKTHVTAEEIKEKSGERMAALAPALGQLDHDQNSKIINNAVMILESQKKLPQRPRDLEGDNLQPKYISILALASKVSMMNSIERASNFIVSFATSTQQPELIRVLKGEKVVRTYLDSVAIDPELVATEEEMETVRQGIAEQQQQQNVNLQLQQQAELAKNMSQAKIGEGSMLDTMLEASGA